MFSDDRNICIGYMTRMARVLFVCVAIVSLLSSCAKMGSPDGGWYDETPPRVIGASPADGSVNVDKRKIDIFFNEYVTLDNPTEKVVVSPPQIEQPEIKGMGKHIQVLLRDSLKPNTTYTIDFSDAIADNNEGNPLGNYAYTFSTGSAIDTMQVSGIVLEADNLEPVKGILVGLYDNLADSAFTHLPMLRVSRTDSRGRFVIKGVRQGSYRIYALQDADNNYMYNQKSEMLAFNHDIVVPSSKPDVRQDTLWRDSLHIKAIQPVSYTHFFPDDIVLKAFTETLTDRFFLKADRQQPDHFTLFFSYGSDRLPDIKGINFNSENAFITEASEKRDTVTYWLRDTSLVNQDTLRMQVSYMMTDSTGTLVNQTDTLDVLAKESYAHRMKQKQRDMEKWQKQQKKRQDDGLPFDSVYPPELLKPDYIVERGMRPDQNVHIMFPAPLSSVDSSKVHLYAKHDTLWYRSPFLLRETRPRSYDLLGEWRPGIEYSLEIDSCAFTDIYGRVNGKFKQGFKVKSNDEFSSLLVTVEGLRDSSVVMELLDKSDKVIRKVNVQNSQAEFYYLEPGTYYLRLFIDSNNNGLWDTGCYSENRQPETVCYYPKEIVCREKWDVEKTWNPLSVPVEHQKPGVITKQKPDKEKKIKNRNAQRARQLGIQYVEGQKM